MALTAKSLFTYGLEVTTLNRNLDFVAVMSGPTLTAVLDLGFYSVKGLADAVATAMKDVDPLNSYIVTVDFSIGGGTQNRITITSTASFLSLLFASGPNTTTTCATLIGFNVADYTGSTAYTGSSTVGTTLSPDYLGYNYLDDKNQAKIFGAVNVSAAGLKEAVTFNFQHFVNVEYRYEPKSKLVQWVAFFNWSIQQRPFDFIPEVTSPTNNFQLTLENTDYDGKGLGFRMKEMLPNFPNHYQTGPLTMRVVLVQSDFFTG